MTITHLVAAFAAAASIAPASAQTASGSARSMIVRTVDLDLGSPRGVATLDRRVHHAAVEVCGKAPDFDVPGRNAAKRCVAKVKADVAPSLTAAIAARTGVEFAANR